MQTAEKIDASPTGLVERALDAELSAAVGVLTRDGGLSQENAASAQEEIRRETWTGILSAPGDADPVLLARRAGLLGVARAIRRHGLRDTPAGGGKPLPEGLTADALRGALMEVIPGQRSVAGLYLRGYGADDLAVLYGLEAADMRSRLTTALEKLRSSLHRRAERMNVAAWSRALESQPIEAVQGMLLEGTSPETRLRCTDPDDQAEALNGTHFRGGREGALDHAITCDPCAAELRILFTLRRTSRPAGGRTLDATELDGIRREARSRPDLREHLDAAREARPVRHRRTWPWVIFALAGALAAWLLL